MKSRKVDRYHRVLRQSMFSLDDLVYSRVQYSYLSGKVLFRIHIKRQHIFRADSGSATEETWQIPDSVRLVQKVRQHGTEYAVHIRN